MTNPFKKMLGIWQSTPNYTPNTLLWAHSMHVLGGCTILVVAVAFRVDWELATVAVAFFTTILEFYQWRKGAGGWDSFYDGYQYLAQIALSQIYYEHWVALPIFIGAWFIGYAFLLFFLDKKGLIREK